MSKRMLLGLALLLAGCLPAAPGGGEAGPPALPAGVEVMDYGPAPELTNEVWLNVDQPLRLADLRGWVVLIDMWTFG